jgi:hypothetical protein
MPSPLSVQEPLSSNNVELPDQMIGNQAHVSYLADPLPSQVKHVGFVGLKIQQPKEKSRPKTGKG